MLTKYIICGLMIGFALSSSADFPSDFKAAKDQYSQKEYQKANESFLKLAEAAPTPKSKAQCQAWAALSLARHGQYEQAIELAKKIELKPVSVHCRMEIMLENKKFKELVEAFKDEDINAWPDYLIHHGFFKRGSAYRATNDNVSAAKDLEKAVETGLTSDRFLAIAWNDLGGIYLALKEDDKALNAFRQVLVLFHDKNNYLYYSSVLSATGILTRQAKYDEALAELKNLDLSKPSGTYGFQALKAFGDICLAQGKKDEAVAKYKEALAVTNAPKSYLDDLAKKLNEISGK
ncbi:MAG: tetratricopeptide repeat protein [Kiritimatiellia bacterium]